MVRVAVGWPVGNSVVLVSVGDVVGNSVGIHVGLNDKISVGGHIGMFAGVLEGRLVG